MELKNKKVVIIGGGLGGLSSAAYMAKEGANVVVLEKNKLIGGRASVYQEKGFTFDIGPSWYLMPDVFEKFFADFNKKPSDYFDLVKLSPSYKIFTQNNEQIEIPAKLEDLYELFDQIEPNGATKLKNYLAEAELKYKISLESFVYNSYRSPKDFFNKKLLTEAKKLTVFKSLESHVKQHFQNDIPRKILQYSVVFLGASPNNAPALYSLISHADLNLGVFYPIGGIVKLSEAIKSLCLELGVKIHTEEPVTHIKTQNGKATFVETTKHNYQADVVIANADYAHVETMLLDKDAVSINEKSWHKKTLAPSAFILFLGINKKLKSLEHHNFIWKTEWDEHFDSIFKKQALPTNPSFYVCAPSVTDSSVAPQNNEALFVLIPSAVGLPDNEEIRNTYRNLIIDEIEKYTHESIRDNIILEKTFFINDFKNMFNAYKGTGLGLAHTLMQSAIFRPKNYSKKISNLFYTGQYTNPGTGMPMVLISSKIVLNEIKKMYD